jgi:hypothetical protein
MAVMRRISPVVKLRSDAEVIKKDGEYIYLDASREIASR